MLRRPRTSVRSLSGEERRLVLDELHKAHPERFVHGVPSPQAPPSAAWINPPTPSVSNDKESL